MTHHRSGMLQSINGTYPVSSTLNGPSQEALQTNTHVLSLQLSACALGSSIAAAVRRLLAMNDHLEELNLDNNALTSEAIDELIDAVAASSSLLVFKAANQSHPLHSRTETRAGRQLDANHSVLKVSLSLRDKTAFNALERVLMRNREERRLARQAARTDDEEARARRLGLDAVVCGFCEKAVFAAEAVSIDVSASSLGDDDNDEESKSKSSSSSSKLVAAGASTTLVVHQKCFRCRECKKRLDLGNFLTHERRLYCKPHYMRVVKLSSKKKSRRNTGAANAVAQRLAAVAAAGAIECVVCRARVFPTDSVALTLGARDDGVVRAHGACVRCATSGCEKRLSAKSVVGVREEDGKG